MTPREIISANALRRAERERLHRYDPETGEGSTIERYAVRIDESVTWHLPTAMQEAMPALAGTLRQWCKKEKKDFEEVLTEIKVKRLFYDFEYWCARCVTIERRDGTLGPLVLTLPQRRSLARRELQRLRGRPIRQIEVKHRRYGSTTEKGFYVVWLQRMLGRRKRLNSYMISLEQGGSAKMLRRVELFAEREPTWLKAHGLGSTLRAVRSEPNARLLVETGGTISIASVNNPQGPSGDTAQIFLISEAGKMGSSSMQNADRLITNITSIVPSTPSSCLIVESTAERVGQWFRREVERARRGEGPYDLHFTCWMDDPVCERPLDSVLDDFATIESWIASWKPYYHELWSRGASLEMIWWYAFEESQKPTVWMMRQENPTTIDEAFQSGGERKFPAEHVAAARASCREPLRQGRLVADGLIGKAALSGIRFVDDPTGPLKIWREPGDDFSGVLPRKVVRRYVVGADPNAGTSESADNGVGVVLDRAPVLLGSQTEVAAEWCGKVETRQFAWEMARLAKWYDRAELVVEVNSLIEDTGEGHDPSITVLDEILPYYRRIYHRRVRDKESKDFIEKAGYFMSRPQKLLAITALQRGLRVACEVVKPGHVEDEEDYLGLIERCEDACTEYDRFQQHDDGSMGATPKSVRSDPDLKDDRVIARAIAKQISDEMRAPSYVAKERKTVPREAGYATF